MPLPYRTVSDIYNSLKDAGVVSQSLPEWAQGMNNDSGTDMYSAGLGDNWIKRASTNIDRALDWTRLPEALGNVGEKVGGLFGAPEAGRAAFEAAPRGVIDFLPMSIGGPVTGAARAAQLLGTYLC